MTTQPAGWYDDPEMVNTRRYWDGSAWTDQRQEKGAASAPATVQGTASSSSLRRWVVGGIVVAIILATVVLRLVYGGDGGGGGSTTYDPADLEDEIEMGLIKKGVTVNDLICSGADSVRQGDVTICDGTDSDGSAVSVTVTFNSDGSYVWASTVTRPSRE